MTRVPGWLRAVALSFIVLASVLAGGAVLAEPVAAAGPAGMTGNGTDADPYVVTNATQLQAMDENLTASYALGTDVDASGVTFRPVGNNSVPFEGSFDGRNHTISNLTVRKPGPDWVGVGLFGRSDGDVRDVTLRSVDAAGDVGVGGLVGLNAGEVVRSSATVDVRLERSPGTEGSDRFFGGLVGLNDGGTVRASSAAGDVSGDVGVGGLVGGTDGGTVTASSATSDVDGQVAVGGLVGYHSGTVTRSDATGSVEGQVAVGVLVGWSEGGTVRESSAAGDATGRVAVGGLVGLNQGAVRRSSAASDTASTTGANFFDGDEQAFGGLVGRNQGTVNQSWATGTVSGSFDVGGLVGHNDGGFVTRSYATADVGDGPGIGQSVVGGLVGDGVGAVERSYWDERASGRSSSAGGTGLTTDRMTGASARTNMTFDYGEAWVVTDSYPKLAWAADSLAVSANATIDVGDATAATVTATFPGEAVGNATLQATYVSADPGVATVDPDGTITGVGGGTTTVAAELGDARATTTVRVRDDTPPVASAGSDRTVEVGESVVFDASGANAGDTVSDWLLGDGTRLSGPRIVYTYTEPGTYGVTLTVRDRSGTVDVDTMTVTVVPAVSLAVDAGPNRTVENGTAVTLNATATNATGNVSYDWTFGDGTRANATPENETPDNGTLATATGSTATHTYPEPGVYVATVTATDQHGSTATDATTVTVTPATTPPPTVQCPRVDGAQGIDVDGDGRCEDVNGDGAVDLGDAISMLFVDADALTVDERAAIDFDSDGDVDLADAIALLFDR